MRVFDFDGTIYDGESLFDLYLYSARHDPKVFRYIAPVLRYAVKYKLGRATLEQMEYGVGKMTEGYLTELSRSKRVASVEQLVDDFWDRYYARIKPWYQPESDDVILTASFGLTVGKACRRLGVRNLVASEVDVETMRGSRTSTSAPTRPNGSANCTVRTSSSTSSTPTPNSISR